MNNRNNTNVACMDSHKQFVFTLNDVEVNIIIVTYNMSTKVQNVITT